jgi:hypothetical protein
VVIIFPIAPVKGGQVLANPPFTGAKMKNLNPSTLSAARQIRNKVLMVATDGTQFGVLSTGERIAVAMVLNRHDLLDRAWGTILESVHRLGPEWIAAALYVQRNGWADDSYYY